MPDTAEHRFPCHTCGADLRFDPQTMQLVCDHCGATEAVDENPWKSGAMRELDFQAAIAEKIPDSEFEETRVTSCENCGAQVEFLDEEHAKECPFCATPLVIGTGAHRQIKPKGVLPFAIPEGDARKAMNKWLGRLWFAPNGLQQFARAGRQMQGIYVPYWTFDADTKSTYRGQRGDAYTEMRMVSVVVNGKRTMQSRPVTKIRWSRVSGRVARFFDDVLVLASHSLPKKHTDAIAPWDLSALEPYAPEYLAGFRAEGYAVDLEDAFTEAREIMDRRIVRDVKFDIGGDRQRIDELHTTVADVTFKHVLLPVWLAAYKYRGESYRFVVNARTGAISGERPYSTIKIVFAVILAVLGIGTAAILAAYFQQT